MKNATAFIHFPHISQRNQCAFQFAPYSSNASHSPKIDDCRTQISIVKTVVKFSKFNPHPTLSPNDLFSSPEPLLPAKIVRCILSIG